MRVAGAERGGEDHGGAGPLDALATGRRPGGGGRLRRGAPGGGGMAKHRVGGSARGGGRGAHGSAEPGDVRAALPSRWAGGQEAGGRVIGAVRALGGGGQAGEALLGRDEAASGPRGELHPLAAGAVPGRADDRARPTRAQRGVGCRPLAGGRGDDGAFDDAVFGRGGPVGGPDRRDGRRARHR